MQINNIQFAYAYFCTGRWSVKTVAYSIIDTGNMDLLYSMGIRLVILKCQDTMG